MLGKPVFKEITASETWPLRQEVMWPDKPIAFVQLPQDEAGLHFGLEVENQIISVVSLFIDREKKEAQFRKFATKVIFQRKGFGRRLLEDVFEVAKHRGVEHIWCHARTSAKSFYLALGLTEEGPVFNRDGVDYVKMSKAFI